MQTLFVVIRKEDQRAFDINVTNIKIKIKNSHA